MASVTLAEAAKLTQSSLLKGVIEEIITIEEILQVLPFDNVVGNTISYNRENALGDVQSAAVGDTITATAAATFTQINSSLTKIIGQVDIDNMIANTQSNKNDQTAIQIGSKFKAAARSFQNQLINGTGSSNQFTGLISLCDAGNIITAGANGAELSFSMLDELADTCVTKGRKPDAYIMHRRTYRKFKALLRGVGGLTMRELNGAQIPNYDGIDIFISDFIPINQTLGSGSALTSVFAVNFDDGSQKVGLAGLKGNPGTEQTENGGLGIEYIGPHPTKDETCWRVKWYCGLALYATKGLGMLKGVI